MHRPVGRLDQPARRPARSTRANSASGAQISSRLTRLVLGVAPLAPHPPDQRQQPAQRDQEPAAAQISVTNGFHHKRSCQRPCSSPLAEHGIELAVEQVAIAASLVLVGGLPKKRCCGNSSNVSPSRVALRRASSADQLGRPRARTSTGVDPVRADGDVSARPDRRQPLGLERAVRRPCRRCSPRRRDARSPCPRRAAACGAGCGGPAASRWQPPKPCREGEPSTGDDNAARARPARRPARTAPRHADAVGAAAPGQRVPLSRRQRSNGPAAVAATSSERRPEPPPC